MLQRKSVGDQHTFVGNKFDASHEKPLRRAANPALRSLSRAAEKEAAPSLVHSVLCQPGTPLDDASRIAMEARFGRDFSHVRLHTDAQSAESARSVNAMAYTVGNDVVFGAEQYAPRSSTSQRLLAHELAHVVQQGGQSNTTPGQIELAAPGSVHEAEADRTAEAVGRGEGVPSIQHSSSAAIQRKVEMRDVGRGEQSGFARLPELIDRLNQMSPGLTYSLNGKELAYETKEGGTPSYFDRQMIAFIDQETLVPLRLTNRHGLLGDKATGFHDQVDVDAFTSGYVDIDDLLASSDLGLQSVLVHFLRERTATGNYARRIGTDFTQKEFDRGHALGIQDEAALLQDFFGDPTIHIVNDSPSPTVRRVFRNSRRDLIRRRVGIGRGEERGVNAMSIDVRTHDGQTLTAEEYRELLEREREQERIRRQVERERLSGATEYHAGGHSIPAP